MTYIMQIIISNIRAPAPASSGDAPAKPVGPCGDGRQRLLPRLDGGHPQRARGEHARRRVQLPLGQNDTVLAEEAGRRRRRM